MRNWRTDEGNAENKVGMRGIRWESESEESVWGCRELRWKVWR